MKVYVDELPKSCWNCECGGNCCYFNVNDGIPKDCPLQSLTDYTNQVRKEVVQEIRKHIPICSGMPMVIMLDDTHSLNNILDQIQGETK